MISEAGDAPRERWTVPAGGAENGVVGRRVGNKKLVLMLRQLVIKTNSSFILRLL